MSSHLRGGLLGAGAVLAHRVLRRHVSAAVCHRFLACALAALALMPLLIACCDGWAVLPHVSQAERPTVVPTVNSSVAAPVTAKAPMPVEVAQLPNEKSIRTGHKQTPAFPSSSAEAAMTPKPAASIRWPAWESCLAAGWVLGMMAVVAGLGREMLRLHRLRGLARLVEDASLLAEARRCAASIGLRRVPEIRLMNQDDGPLVIGSLRPAVMLPATFQDWPEERRSAVLLHELAHVLRRDGLVQLHAALTCALHWCNPFAWLLLKRLRHEAECACDDVVLSANMEAPCYADHLLAVASGGRGASVLAPSMAQASGLRQRVQAVLSTTVRRGAVGRLAGLVILVSAVALSLPVMLAQSADPKLVLDDKKPAPADAKKSPAPTKVAVSLQTMDAKGHALGGVSLRGFNQDKEGPLNAFAPDFTGTTDEQGRWQGELPFGRFMVLATKGRLVAPYGDDKQTWWYLGKNNLKRDLKLKLVEGGDVEVAVLEAGTLKPVPKAKVIMDHGHTAITDDAGKAQFTAVSLGEHSLKAISGPFADRTVEFNSTDQASSTVEVLLEPGFEVRGRVTNSEGLPVKDAVVRSLFSGDYLLVGTQRCVTDAEGNYTLGWYSKSAPLSSLRALHKDYAALTKRALGPPAEGTVVHCDFVMDKGGEIAGVVKDEDGKPIKGASVRYGTWWATGDLRMAITDAEGRFRITKIGSDEGREIVAEAKGHAVTWQKAIPGKGESVPQLEFVMKKGFTAKVRLVDRDGNGVPGIAIGPRVKIGRDTEFVDGRIDGDIYSDAEGYFQITSLPETGAFFNGSAPGIISQVRDCPVDTTKPLIVVVVDKPGVIKGRVVDAETRQPVKKFNVRLGWPKAKKDPSEPNGSFSAHLSSRGQDVQSEDGSFVIEGLITRVGLAVFITAEGYTKSYTDKVMVRPADDPSWPVEFVVDTGNIVLGQLTEEGTGRPVSGARVLVVAKEKWHGTRVSQGHLARLDSSPTFDDVMEYRSDASGAVEIRLPREAVSYTAVIMQPGCAPVVLENQSPSDPVLHAPPLVREAKVRGTAAGIAGLDVSKDQLIIYTKTYDSGWIKLAPDGSFEIRGLPVGKAVLTLDDGLDQGPAIRCAALLDLKGGEVAQVNLAAQAEVSVLVTDKGKPVSGADVGVGIQWPFGMEVGKGVTGADGTVTLRHLPFTKVTISCGTKERRVPSKAIDLGDPRQPPVIEFDLGAVAGQAKKNP